jgi:hypothetical protein
LSFQVGYSHCRQIAFALLPPGDYLKSIRQIGERADTHTLDKKFVVFSAESALTKNNAGHPIESNTRLFFGTVRCDGKAQTTISFPRKVETIALRRKEA